MFKNLARLCQRPETPRWEQTEGARGRKMKSAKCRKVDFGICGIFLTRMISSRTDFACLWGEKNSCPLTKSVSKVPHGVWIECWQFHQYTLIHRLISTLPKAQEQLPGKKITYCYTHLSATMDRYLLTPWCIVLLEKLTGLQLVKKFAAFHGTRRFITALTSVRHLSLSWASPIQSTYPRPISWRSILILSTHLRLGLHSGLLPSGNDGQIVSWNVKYNYSVF